ncbi:hypothetical protein LFM09_48280 [Lentzea alba]|uniref:hypothetical protein n=1 Tax=Lentzea alba TaxID=2714351 RepID=UPI0039BF0EAE
MDTALEGLASNPALPASLLDRLVLVEDEAVSLDLALRPDLRGAHVRVLLSRSPAVASVLLSSGRVSPCEVPTSDPWFALVVASVVPAVARSLAVHPDPAVRVRLASCSLSPDVVLQLVQDSSDDVVAEVVRSHAVPPELALALSTHPQVEVRRALASSSSTPAVVLERLSSDERCAYPLAVNPATPTAVAVDLMRFPQVHLWLAERTDLPASVYSQLAVGGPRIQSRLVANPAVPLSLLISVAGSRAGSGLVPRVASASEAELRVLASSGVSARMLLAARPDLPADLFSSLVADPSVASVLVTNPSLTVAQLRGLVMRDGPALYPWAARNPLCPGDLLHHMALQGSASVETYRAIAEHPQARGETLLLCLEDSQARHAAACHPRLPVEKIVELLGSEFTARPAASNPSLPVHVMEGLLSW